MTHVSRHLRAGTSIRPRPQRLARLGGQRGQGMVEYALILILVAVVVVLILLTQGQALKNIFSNVACGLGASGCSSG